MSMTLHECLESLTEQGKLNSYDSLSTVDSTNSHAMQWLIEQSVESIPHALPRLVITETQTAGRGRSGNQWTACDDGMALSLVVSNQGQWMSLASGIALALAIESVASLRSPCGLKWPNDVWLDDRKVAGILIEGWQSFAVVGIGVNLNSRPALPGVAVGSIAECCGHTVSRESILPELIGALLDSFARIKSHPDQLLANYRQRCVLTGQQVRGKVGTRELTGRCLGINSSGHLQLQTATGIETCHSGEVSQVRPIE